MQILRVTVRSRRMNFREERGRSGRGLRRRRTASPAPCFPNSPPHIPASRAGNARQLVQGARQVPPRRGSRLLPVATPVMHLASSRPATQHPPGRTTPGDFVAVVLKRTRTLCSQAYFRSPVGFSPYFGGTSSQGTDGTARIPDRVRGQEMTSLCPHPGGSLIPRCGTRSPRQDVRPPARARHAKRSLSCLARLAVVSFSAPQSGFVPLDAPPPWTGEDGKPAGAGCAGHP